MAEMLGWRQALSSFSYFGNIHWIIVAPQTGGPAVSHIRRNYDYGNVVRTSNVWNRWWVCEPFGALWICLLQTFDAQTMQHSFPSPLPIDARIGSFNNFREWIHPFCITKILLHSKSGFDGLTERWKWHIVRVENQLFIDLANRLIAG